MNTRQKAKKLKKEIRALKSDNHLMRDIIADVPAMQELYDAYKQPTFVYHSTMQFQEFRVKRTIPAYRTDFEDVVKYLKQSLANYLFEDIKENINYEVDTECESPTITASVFVGRK